MTERFRLIVIDPLSAFSSRAITSDAAARQCLGPLAQLAQRTNTAVIVVRHLTKGGGGGSVLYRGGGSISVIGLARSAMQIIRDPEDDNRRIAVQVKSNLGPLAESLVFQPQATDDGSVITWTGTSTITARDLEPTDGRVGGQALQRAMEFLVVVLADRPEPAMEVYAKAALEGHSRRTLERAKDRLGVRSERSPGFGLNTYWEWSLDESNQLSNELLNRERAREADRQEVMLYEPSA